MTWNVRSFLKHSTLQRVCKVINEQKVTIAFITETWDRKNLEKILVGSKVIQSPSGPTKHRGVAILTFDPVQNF